MNRPLIPKEFRKLGTGKYPAFAPTHRKEHFVPLSGALQAFIRKSFKFFRSGVGRKDLRPQIEQRVIDAVVHLVLEAT